MIDPVLSEKALEDAYKALSTQYNPLQNGNCPTCGRCPTCNRPYNQNTPYGPIYPILC